jgi:uncharacterized protein (TIGR02246 family)
VAEVSDLYNALLDAWNGHDAAAYAALFTEDGYVVGFDGSEMNGREEIERSSWARAGERPQLRLSSRSVERASLDPLSS